MKNLIQKILGGALLFCLILSLTSCEELFGEWTKPVPASVVQEAKVLGAALEVGATVTVNYSVGSKNYVAKFTKNSDDSYTLISNTYISGARAMTRAAAPATVPTGDASTVGDKVKLVVVGGKLKLIVKDTNGAPLFEANMNIDGGEVAIINTNALGLNCTIGSVAVNDDTKAIKNPEMQKIIVNFTYNLTSPVALTLTFDYAVQYINGEKWSDVVARYKDCEHGEIGTTEDDYLNITFEKTIAKEVITKAVADAGATSVVDENTIDLIATTVSQIKLYLYTQEEVVLTTRAMTRDAAPSYKYTPVQSAETIDANKTYVLLTKIPGVTDLSTLTSDYEVPDGETLTGSTDSYKVTIPAGATVTLAGVNISGTSYCIKCAGDATIILKDGTTNTLTSTSAYYPALWAGDTNTTLTIQGNTGVLDVTSGSNYAGIGGGYRNTDHTCGNIRIEGGFITARGGAEAAGIGTDYGPATCGDIIITGGTINATGGQDATGIGAGRGAPGNPSNCGAITITNGVTKVTATKGVCTDLIDCIGAGYGNSSCGTVTIGGTVYWENNAYANGGDTYLTTSPLIYPQSE